MNRPSSETLRQSVREYVADVVQTADPNSVRIDQLSTHVRDEQMRECSLQTCVRLIEANDVIDAGQVGEHGRDLTPAIRHWAAVALIEDALEQCDGHTVERVLVG
jgi:hypothetical protein